MNRFAHFGWKCSKVIHTLKFEKIRWRSEFQKDLLDNGQESDITSQSGLERFNALKGTAIL